MTNEEQQTKIIKKLLNGALPKKEKEKEKEKESAITVSDCQGNIKIYQNATINNNYKQETKKVSVKRLYPPGTIGYNGIIKGNIDSLIKQIIEARMAIKNRDINSVSKVFYSEFNRHFGIPQKNVIYDFPEYRASEILEYLNKIYDNTKEGRIKKAASRKGYIHSVGHYFGLEKELLKKLNKKSDDEDLKDFRFRLFNVKSRKELTQEQWAIYIDELNRRLENLFK